MSSDWMELFPDWKIIRLGRDLESCWDIKTKFMKVVIFK